jgi:hypothetical protein
MVDPSGARMSPEKGDKRQVLLIPGHGILVERLGRFPAVTCLKGAATGVSRAELVNDSFVLQII